MPKMIDADKLIGLLGYLIEATDSKLEKNLLWSILGDIESGKCDPTPPVQPDTPDPGDKVRHKEHAYKKYGIGVVKEISKSGKQAYVSWPNFDRALCSYAPSPSYYRLDKLEVITDDQPTKEA